MARDGRKRSRAWIWWAAGTALLAAAIVYESVRDRPELAEGVQSRPPGSAEELSRLESGFKLNVTREGQVLFDLLADSQVGLKGGATFVKGVRSFTFYTEDGRPVVVSAARGRLQQVGSGEQDVQASLQGEVVVKAPDGLVLRTDELVYDTRLRTLRSPGAARITGPGVAAMLAGFTYEPDGKVVEADGPVEVESASGLPWRLDAGRAVYAVPTGRLRIDTPFRARQAGRTILGGPGTFAAPPAPATARLEAQGPVLLSGTGEQGAVWQLAASSLAAEGLLPKGAQAIARVVDLGGPSSLALRGPDGAGGVRTEKWRLEADPAGRPARALAGPPFTARWDAADGKQRWTLDGEWLDLRFARDGKAESAEARGAVRATASDGTTAEGSVLRWDARRADEVLLTGDAQRTARVRRAGDLVEAPRVIVDRARRVVVAEGGPITEAASLRRDDGSLFRGSEPVRVRSARVTFPEKDAPIEFEGPVQVWQGDATLRAARLRVARETSRLNADGKVQVSLPLGEPGKDDRRRVRLFTEHLDYDGSSRVAVLTGGATYEEPQARIEAERIEARLRPDGGVEELTATGKVKLLVQGHHGRADRVEWRGGPLGIVTLFGETAPATLESPTQGNLKQQAARIRYDLQARRGTAEGRGGRTTLEGVPPPKGPSPAAPPAPAPGTPRK